MDGLGHEWYFSDMNNPTPIPVWQLYGEEGAFPDVLHVERIVDRAAGLDWTIGAHRHAHLHQFLHLASGAVEMTLDGETVHARPPFVISVPRGAVHGFTFAAGTEGHVLTLPAAHFPELFGPTAETAPALSRSFHLAADSAMATRFARIAAQHATPAAYRALILRAEVVALTCDLLTRQTPQESRAQDPRLQAFEAMLREGPAQPLEHYAGKLGVSPRHLSRICQAETGLSAKAFIDVQVMREACRMLAYTRMSVQQIGYHLGFDDPSYFSRAFQRHLGMAPSSYRAGLE
jgi:AraC family transcriptional activator of pobA